MGCLVINCNDCNCDCKKCCCNPNEKEGYACLVSIPSLVIFVFHLVIVVLINNSLQPDYFESLVLEETPFYDLEISEIQIGNKKNATFFHFKGRKQKKGNLYEINDELNITRIFKNKFFYNTKDRNYFDYVNKYSVLPGNDCPNNQKKCGILDSAGRLLCLPNDEECPINGFGISDSNSDPNYVGYYQKEALDSKDNKKYYFYYTNKNINDIIITEFKLSAGKPCAYSSELNWVKIYEDEVEKSYGCESSVKGSKYSLRYTQVSNNVIDIKSLYKDNGLTDIPDSGGYQSASLYVRNYNEVNEICFEKFIKDFKDEKKLFDAVLTMVRVLGAVSVILAIINFIYMFGIFCCHFKFRTFSFIVPVYCILFDIIVLYFLTKSQIKYECNIDEFNEEMNELIEEQYNKNRIANIVLICLSLFFNFISLIFTLCLIFSKVDTERGTATSEVVQVVQPQPALVPAYPPVYPMLYQTKNISQHMMSPPGSIGVPYSKEG